jgi:hypothetical protein
MGGNIPMLYTLSKEESFKLLNKKFYELKVFEVLDLCHDNSRFPCFVLSIDVDKREFSVVPINEDFVRDVVKGRSPDIYFKQITVTLPDNAEEVHPMWNVLGN